MEEEKKVIQIFRPVVRKQLPFKTLVLSHESGKGWQTRWEPFVFEFPPPFLAIVFTRKRKGD